MKNCLIFVAILLSFKYSFSQENLKDSNNVMLHVLNHQGYPLPGSTLEIFKGGDNNLFRSAISDSFGFAAFTSLTLGQYDLKVSYSGYLQHVRKLNIPLFKNELLTIRLVPGTILKEVSITAQKPFIQYEQGKVLINVDASASNAGTSVLEVLEKSPGVTVDHNGTVSLQGKSGVQIFIDGKQTFLSGSDLSNMLSSMSSSQVDQVELITNPSAKYDAGGNAGIINIKTKKSQQEGFNGSLSLSVGQGRYPKTNNTLVVNYRKGKLNSYVTLSANLNEYYTYVYALRKYYDQSGKVLTVLDQPTYFSGTSNSQSLKAGVDYFVSGRTTVGIGVTSMMFHRRGISNASATWLNKEGHIDSSIITTSTSSNVFKNIGTNINFRHIIAEGQEFTVNADWLHYDLGNNQYFANRQAESAFINDASSGNIPSAIKILSIKADHSINFGRSGKIESGFKRSDIETDNLADYNYFNGTTWSPDFGKSNHFLYNEKISALYASVQQQIGKVNMQAGIRYEKTDYNANQLGNPLRKDSMFSKKYEGLFPSGFVSYTIDSINTISFTAGRRIDRPAFQKLNPFIFIINKYTYQSGNPFFLPQYSWNMELSHLYKSILTTTLSYSIIKNYFSQLFLTDDNGLLYYSEGNVGRAFIAGLSVSAQLSPLTWWSLSGQVTYNYKNLSGIVYKVIKSSVNQLSINISNEFKIGNKYIAELSGFYISRSRNDLQEILFPTSLVAIAFSRPVLNKKGSLKLTVRDIFYTIAMQGDTQFENATEYFIIKRDSRIATLGFTYRFGKSLKSSGRSTGGANEEIDRVGAGN